MSLKAPAPFLVVGKSGTRIRGTNIAYEEIRNKDVKLHLSKLEDFGQWMWWTRVHCQCCMLMAWLKRLLEKDLCQEFPSSGFAAAAEQQDHFVFIINTSPLPD